MKQRIHLVTLAVEDLERSLSFYRALGFESSGIIGREFEGDARNPAGATAIFQLDAGMILALYPRTELAKDANIAPHSNQSGEFSLGHLVAQRDEVDTLLEAAERAGATLTDPAHERPWGIYSGYFHDPDGHLWEIIWNPRFSDV